MCELSPLEDRGEDVFLPLKGLLPPDSDDNGAHSIVDGEVIGTIHSADVSRFVRWALVIVLFLWSSVLFLLLRLPLSFGARCCIAVGVVGVGAVDVGVLVLVVVVFIIVVPVVNNVLQLTCSFFSRRARRKDLRSFCLG